MKTERSLPLKSPSIPTSTHWFNKQATLFDTYRFGAMSMMMIFQSCLGSIAAMLVVDLINVIPLVITAMITMASNAICIAQGPAKWCLSIFYASVVINLSIIIITSII